MEYKYKAFISYRHAERDSAAAKAVHTAIERYVIPKKLRKDGKKRMGKVFRDEEELRASSDLSADICQALDQSEYLIVICSPDTLSSHWVPKEIAYFREHRDRKNILTVLTGGAAGEIFPALMPGMPEPLFLDLTQSSDDALARDLKDRFRKLCARLLDCEYDDLVRREQVRRKRNTSLIILGVLIAIGCLVCWNLQIRDKNRELEQVNGALTNRTEELALKTEELEQQNDELLLRDSEILTMNALEALDDGDRLSALSYALSALPSTEGDRPYYAPAERAVFSALRPFLNAEKNYIFYGTAMEQTTSIQDFCVSTDGKRLVTVDSYHTLRCFDTVTGTLLWDYTVSNNRNYDQPQLFLCGQFGSVLYCNDSTFAAVSLETGELLWLAGEPLCFSDAYILCEDAGYLAFITRYHQPDTESFTYAMAIRSLRDGTVTARIPIAEGAYRAHAPVYPNLYFPEINGRDLRPYTVLSGGRFIVSAYSVDDMDICYFCVDTWEQTCTELYRDEYDDFVDTQVYHLERISEGSSLLVVRDHPEQDEHIVVERISLEDQTMLWQREFPMDGSEGVFVWLSSVITLAAEDDIFRLDLETGMTKYHYETDAPIRDFTLNSDSTYTLLLGDGRTTTGWFNNAGFRNLETQEDEQIDLGSCTKGTIWNHGSIRLEFEDGKYHTFRMYSEDDGGGFVVTIPDDAAKRVVVHRPRQTPLIPTGDAPLTLEGMSFHDYQLFGKDDLALFNLQSEGSEIRTCIIVDPTTLQPKTTYHYSGYINDEEVLFLADGSGFLLTDNGSIYLFDAQTMTWRLLSEAEEGAVPEPGADPVPEYCYGASSARISDSGDILSAALTDTGLFLWCNGRYLRQVEYPADQEDLYYWSGCHILTGSNGYVMTWDPEQSERYFYDVGRDTWHRLTCDDTTFLLGNDEPIVLSLLSDGTIRIFDILTGAIRTEVVTGIRDYSLRDALLCRDDTVLAVLENRTLHLYDLSSGQRVLSTPISWVLADKLACYEDPEKDFLFFCDNTTYCEGVCVAVEGWQVLSKISDFLAYDNSSGRIIRCIPELQQELYAFYSLAFPTTEELVAMGKEFLGE